MEFLRGVASTPDATPEQAEKEFFERHRPTSLIQRMAEDSEVASLVAYLASPLASATNGARVESRAAFCVRSSNPDAIVFNSQVSGLGVKCSESFGGDTGAGQQKLHWPRARLRIAHLLGWTVASALGFAAYRGITPRPAPGAPSVIIGVYDSVMGLALGTILTGVGVMAYRRWWGRMSYPSLPGHWLLILGLAAAAANGAAIAVFKYLTRLYYPPSKWPPGTVYLPKVILVQFLISKHPDLIGVNHQAVGWGLGAVAALAVSWHVRSPAVMALAWSLCGIWHRRCDPLRGARPVAISGPLLVDAEADRRLVPAIGPRLRAVHPARDVRSAGGTCLGCLDPRAGRRASLGRGRDLARHGCSAIRDLPGAFLTVSGQAVPCLLRCASREFLRRLSTRGLAWRYHLSADPVMAVGTLGRTARGVIRCEEGERVAQLVIHDDALCSAKSETEGCRMTRRELALRQRAYEAELHGRVTVRSVALLVAMILVPFGVAWGLYHLPVPEWAATSVAFLGIAGMPFLMWWGAERIKRLQQAHGVLCPSCGKALIGTTGELAMTTARCGGCGDVIVLDDADEPEKTLKELGDSALWD